MSLAFLKNIPVLQFDVKNQRIFLRRTKYNDMHQEDLFIGNRVNVFSRQLHLIDYGDQYTANKLGSKKERYDHSSNLHLGGVSTHVDTIDLFGKLWPYK